MTSLTPGDTRTLIDELLAEQCTLTAVERFASEHEKHPMPAQERQYRDLIPLDRPRLGEQYAFAVDLDACSGCKSCVSACHSLNGLDEEERWRTTGLLHGGTPDQPYQQTITTACHHCADPACLNGCPVLAYEKDGATGIVRHLDDQCIGCQYCVLKCPYDAPKYSAKRGIVRKCDMCYHRLAANEAPACVQACPSGAITIRVVSQTSGAPQGAPVTDDILPGAFESNYTLPTTTYTSRKPIPTNARPADTNVLRLEQPHWPLVWMLILTQTAAGIAIASAMIALFSPKIFHLTKAELAVSVFVVLHLGLVASVLHLGRPLGAWRAFLGVRRSWMSREIVAFGAFGVAAFAFVGGSMLERCSGTTPILAGAVALIGVLGIVCSAMIYVDTRRPFWSASLTFAKFLGTTFMLGLAGFACIASWKIPDLTPYTPISFAIWLSVAIMIVTLLGEYSRLCLAVRHADDPIHRSAVMIGRYLKLPALVRIGLLILGAVFGTFAAEARGHLVSVAASASLATALGSQIIERYWFFRAVDAPRMPGGIAV